MRTLVAISALSLAALTGCSPLVPAASVVSETSEWGAGTKDVRHATALVRVTPPARLKAAFETTAARSSDPDFADFLRAHAGGGFGSGFLVTHSSAQGTAAFVVTNRHVVAESTEAEISFNDGTTYKNCEVVYASTKHDLAVLALPDSALRALGPGLRPAAQDVTDRLPIIATGYPGVGGHPSYQVTDGKVSNAKFTMPEIGLEDSLIQHTAPIDPGSSGGPLTDENGAFVGVNVMLVRSRASMFFAVRSSAVMETVRYAHSLGAHKRSPEWMTAELDKTCTALASELAATTKSGERLTAFVGNAAIADRGLESFVALSRTPLGSDIRMHFFQDPMAAMRRSVLIRLGARSALAGGANGMCASLTAGDAAAIGEGKFVRRAVMTRSGHAMELTWTFEHGAWRVANGEMVEIPEEPAPPKSAKGSAAKGKVK